MINRRTAMKTLVPTITFVAGILIPIILDRLTKGVFSDLQILLVALVIFSFLLIALLIALTINFNETSDTHNQIVNSQKEILSKIEQVTTQFGLVVEFIVDTSGKNDGASYEVSRKLIQEAKDSIIFLDAWAQTSDYELSQTAKEKRQRYYDAITQQIELQ